MSVLSNLEGLQVRESYLSLTGFYSNSTMFQEYIVYGFYYFKCVKCFIAKNVAYLGPCKFEKNASSAVFR